MGPQGFPLWVTVIFGGAVQVRRTFPAFLSQETLCRAWQRASSTAHLCSTGERKASTGRLTLACPGMSLGCSLTQLLFSIPQALFSEGDSSCDAEKTLLSLFRK